MVSVSLARYAGVIGCATVLGLGAGAAMAQKQDPVAAQLCEPMAYRMGLHYQQSAEVAALQRQSYVLASLRLDQALAAHPDTDNLAIITDLDETVLDNSSLLVRDMERCHDYTTWDTWHDWEKEGVPTLIPGALAFLEKADRAGVSIYYISDRSDENKSDTIATLDRLGLPQTSEDHVLLLGPPKAERRASVLKDHTVIMQLGDTLHDFSDRFAGTTPAQDHQQVQRSADHFGHDWIMLPNAAYGHWSDSDLKTWQEKSHQ
ncbi:5'-nucleotidase, lipoprotein e(P4) family [Larsenimonas rhizosphaerae]|uniref:5'-nucleotidase, lipoprotein e(P4) family n=1 Tax=Larsenimonas rhizosphaerae TaxID=2944682 RepID=UPI002033E6A5|nr:HAD family acid phosphatase [Larsenimonas rhizosphaerae]MCM2130263.1 5'-nucleotidase [Larsenimonas rhizosphaerae]